MNMIAREKGCGLSCSPGNRQSAFNNRIFGSRVWWKPFQGTVSLGKVINAHIIRYFFRNGKYAFDYPRSRTKDDLVDFMVKYVLIINR